MNQLYQIGVEFYSGKNLPYFEIFLDKIIKLNQREDVKLIVETEK